MSKKKYELIDPQSLEGFALLDIRDRPKTKRAKEILLQDIVAQRAAGGFFLQSCFTRSELKQYFTPQECEQIIEILTLDLENQ